MRDDQVRYTEAVLHDHRARLDRIRLLRERLDNDVWPPSEAYSIVGASQRGTAAQTSEPERWAIKRAEGVVQKKLSRELAFHRAVENAVSYLPQEEARFVQLRYFDGHSHNACAQELGFWGANTREPLRSYWNLRLRALEQVWRHIETARADGDGGACG